MRYVLLVVLSLMSYGRAEACVMTPQDLDEQFVSVDVNHDNKISIEELKTYLLEQRFAPNLLGNIPEDQGLTAEMKTQLEEKADRYFKKNDTIDPDNFITRDEFGTLGSKRCM